MQKVFFYHLPDDKTHNFAFTGKVAKDLIAPYPDLNIIWFKSDNCSVQYKSKKYLISGLGQKRSSETYCSVLWPMGRAWLMLPVGLVWKIRSKSISKNFFFFFEFLSQSNANDDKKVYLHITKEGISKLHNNETEITKIKENRKIHCLAFKPDGRIIVQYKLTWKLFYTIMITVMLMM